MTSTITALANTAATDDNPFLGSLPYDDMVYAEPPSQALQLEDQLCILSIHSPQASSVSQSDADSTSEASAIHQKQRKDAQDVKAFFWEGNGW